MATIASAEPPLWTLADLLEYFGPIPAYRIRNNPPPGWATEQDVIDIEDREDRLCELVHGILVEKPMGFEESRLAVALIFFLESFVGKNNLGIVAGEAGMMRLAPGLVRIPDVSFVSYKRFAKRDKTRKKIPNIVPDLAVEVLSEGNTKKEMKTKLREYFQVGVRLVWYIDPKTRTVEVFIAPDKSVLLTEKQKLDGCDVLPGFSLSIKKLFARATRTEPRG
jgi:Uma2 family endonuclease